MRLNQKQITESRIRDIKRKMLHQKNKDTRELWKNHILYLESQLN